MKELRQALPEVEDLTLVELSNKGTVKRAYKDLEQEQPTVCWRGGESGTPEEAEVTMGDAVCRIRIPLSDSICSCPSRSMCRHRIAAILWLKRECAGEKQPLTKEEVEAKREAVPEKRQEEKAETKPKKERHIDPRQAKQLAAFWKEELTLQLTAGLTRLPAETEASMERLALLSHRAGFAELERGAREAEGLYRQYFSRSVAFRTENLMRKLIGLYGQADLVERMEDVEQLAGSFRDTYDPVGELFLMGMGSRAFQGGSGYEGEIYYFLETGTGSWYTWTDVRPAFYEGQRRRTDGSRQAAPWELNCSREQMAEMNIRLTHAKAAAGGRLSVSRETKGDLLRTREPYEAAFHEKIRWDYRELLQQYFSKPQKEQEETDHLVLAGAVGMGEPVFDAVEQRFFLPLYDRNGRTVPVSLRYSKEERYTIRVLERLQKRLEQRQKVDEQRSDGQKPDGRQATEEDCSGMAFFGRLYLEKGQLMLYPIEFFDRLAVPEPDTERENQSFGWGKSGFELMDREFGLFLEVRQLQRFTGYFADVNQVLSDLLQSGLDSVLEETVQGIVRLAAEGEALGLHLAGEKLGSLAEALCQKRHRMSFDPEPVMKLWTELEAYLEVCEELTARDMAQVLMEQKMREEQS
ncbi:MAG: hypothetical protein Q4F28_07000 [Eubacteriales bacterium]|nr:hypothetical protein [Eubacteriales bacterium]